MVFVSFFGWGFGGCSGWGAVVLGLWQGEEIDTLIQGFAYENTSYNSGRLWQPHLRYNEETLDEHLREHPEALDVASPQLLSGRRLQPSCHHAS